MIYNKQLYKLYKGSKTRLLRLSLYRLSHLLLPNLKTCFGCRLINQTEELRFAFAL